MGHSRIKPFHWFIEFFRIIKISGFDVILGNPPWVEYSKVKDEYRVFGLSTLSTNNLFAFVSERSRELLSPHGLSPLILPNSIVSAEKCSRYSKYSEQVPGVGSAVTHGGRQSYLRREYAVAIWIVRPSNTDVCFSTRYNRCQANLENTSFRYCTTSMYQHLSVNFVFPNSRISSQFRSFTNVAL